MGTLTEHIQQANYNESTLDYLITNNIKSIDWIIIITFYYALHFVQAKLERDYHVCPRNHKKRNQCVVNNLPLNIQTLYSSLYIEARKARYADQGVYRDVKTYKKLERLINESKKEFPKLI